MRRFVIVTIVVVLEVNEGTNEHHIVAGEEMIYRRSAIVAR